MLTAASFRPAIATALAAAGLVALTGCSSFDYATDKPNVLANGGYGTSSDSPYGQLRVSGAVIVATTPAAGSGPATAGVFTANLTVAPQTNGSTISDATVANLAVTALALDATNPNITNKADSVSATIATPITVKTSDVETSGTLNMADPQYGGIPVTGTFTPGDVIPVKLTLAKGQTVTLEVPVVKACGVYQFAASKPGAAAEVTAYNNYIAGLNSLPAATEAPDVSTYQCAFPSVRDSQGATAQATVTVTPKPSAAATKH